MKPESVDFAREFGANAPFVEELFARWSADARAVSSDWGDYFRTVAGEPAPPREAAGNGGAPRPRTRQEPAEDRRERASPTAPASEAPAAPKPGDAPPADAAAAAPEPRVEPLRGVAGKIARNMEESLGIPTATSVRTVSVKLLEENRAVLNRHLAIAGMPKASFTHIIAWAFVRALRDWPQLNASYEVRDGQPVRVVHPQINLGLAIDLEGKDGARTLVVPNLKDAASLDFKQFLHLYTGVVDRARKGRLKPEDFQGTTVTLTNPGTIGTVASVPRLMPGQGMILATGAIAWPVEYQGSSPDVMASLGISRILTMTSTYDHRIIQGAESGLLLARIDELLQAGDGFYEAIFGSVRCPHLPFGAARDRNPRLWPQSGSPMEAIEKQARVLQLINAYRVRGSRIADLDPLEFVPARHPELSLEHYGLTLWDLDRTFITGGLGGKPMATLREILEILLDTYCRRIGVEYMHISEPAPRQWLQQRLETTRNLDPFTPDEQRRTLEKLNAAEAFEKFLHFRYLGHKRFSLEGAETLIPMLDLLLDRAAAAGIEEVVIGMAHRGRLNVLVNTIGKSYEKVFTEFEGMVDPQSYQGSGDVKYHLGARGDHEGPEGKRVRLLLASNPSHLEAVNPVVEGMARALQAKLGDEGRARILPLLIHGDAAFAGQGVVAETLNMCQLPGYKTGGTIHIVINNQIGYTAGPEVTRSTHYCTDMAKSVGAPILHVNGDYPESALRTIRIAAEFRERFQHDVVIDLVCYRRHGHNETDEPAYTQPLLYRKIHGHPSVRERYGKLLVERGQLTEERRQESIKAFEEQMKRGLEAVRAIPPQPEPKLPDPVREEARDFLDGETPESGVAAETLEAIARVATEPPEGHVVHPNLARQLQNRLKMVRGEQPVDWGCGEALAFGSLLLEMVPIRLAGQDSGRGTFSQRHAVLRDQETEKDWVPLDHLSERQARFEVHDSLLSEFAAVGFEYGYSLSAPEVLVAWEAQFGDFVNGAQIPIDNFIAASEAKWQAASGVVLLLPHGYDGQGPEHSSARPERFLQLAAEGNLAVAVPSTSAQYFHLLRRHGREPRKRPLVILTPKSLLKKREAGSPVEDFTRGRFEPVLDDPRVQNAAGAKRLLLCAGKVYYDLDEHRAKERIADAAVVRIEQPYPFPRAALQRILARYAAAERIAWVQEEPANMGAWTFIEPRLRALGLEPAYVGRRAAASPASGSLRAHQLEQQDLVARAFRA